MNAGAGNCNPSNSEVGSNGLCYQYCKTGWSPVNDGPICAKDCPAGYAPIGTTSGGPSGGACLKPSFQREIKPTLNCPIGSERQFDKCLLGCPSGTTEKFNLCIPDCPPNFVETKDGLGCQAEFVKRTATVREACYANETRIGGRICLAPCEAGTQPFAENSEMCYATVPITARAFFWTGDKNFTSNISPIISKIISPRTQISATCEKDYENISGQCFAKCPIGSSGLANQCYADCPSDFGVINNQSACLRPTQQRQVVEGLLGSIESVILKFVYGIIGIIVISFIFSRLNAR